MKRITAIVLLFVAICVVACGPAATSAPAQPTIAPAGATQPTRAPAAPTTVAVEPTKPPAAAAATAPAAAPGRGGNLVIATRASAEPASMDAHVDPYANTWLMNSWVTDPLVQLTANGEYKPFLATEWALSADGKSWTFKLRKDVKFHDGTPFNAAAVKFNMDRVMDPATKSALMANYLGVKKYKGSEVVDEFTVKINYDGPVPGALWGMSILPMWSPKAVQELGANFHTKLVGTGAYKMTEWVKGSRIKFEKNPDYKGTQPQQEHDGAAYLDSITFRFVGDDAILGEVLKTGEVNMVMELPAQAVNTYKGKPEYQVVPGYQPGSGMQFVFNTSKAPFDDVRVRQALRYAYDGDKINETLYDNNYVAVKGPLTKFTRCYWKGADDAYKMDLNKARQLLDDAGWKSSGGTAVRQKDGKPLSFTISMLHHKEMGEYLATQFKQIGVDMKVEVIPGPVQLEKVGKGDFDLMYERLRSFEPDDLFSMWYSKNNQPGGWAWSRFQDNKLDETLLKTQDTADPTERCKLFGEAQQIIVDKALALHTLDNPIYYAMSNKVKGFKLGAVGGWFFVKDMYVEK